MKRLRLSRTNKMIAGVCGGISEFIGLDPSIVRIIFALFIILGHGAPVIVYIICWLVIPLGDD